MHEPFGIIVLEGWAAGLCPIASRVGGLEGLIEHERDGLLVDPADDTELCRSICALLDSPETRRSLAEAGRRKAMVHYSWDAVTTDLLNLYDEVLREHSSRP